MPFPETKEGLIAAGYKFKNESHCRGCNALIEWWETPKEKFMPLDPETLIPHWKNCPKAKDFRKGK